VENDNFVTSMHNAPFTPALRRFVMSIRSSRSIRPRIAAALLVFVAAAGAFVNDARAQPFPNKPVRLIVPFPAAGATDILSRELARRLSERLGQQVIVDNRPGAGGAIGTEALARSAPDGYTLQMATSSTHSIGPAVNSKLPYDTRNDFTPIAHVADSPNVLLVAPNVAAGDVRSLVGLLRANPGKYNYGSSGNGTIVHLTSELFKSMTGTFVVHIPYRGTALVVPDMIAGNVHLLFDSVVSAQPHLKEGKLKPLGVTSLARSPLLPELPAIADTVPGFESVTWFGVFAPKGLPADIAAKLNAEINAVVTSAEFGERLRALGAQAAGGSAEQFARKVQIESDKWAKLIRERKLAVQ
jgi:tripartite-type tricarboxylate transporter receptor subunit TctC